MTFKHPFHLVDSSPWPVLISGALFATAAGFIFSLKHTSWLFFFGLTSVVFILSLWFRDIVRESISGKHTLKVRRGLMLGFLLFVLSELMLFFGFFWAYFHASLAPGVELGGVWPPIGITSVDPWSIPLLGSMFLLSSGATATMAHNALINGNKDLALTGLGFTVLLGALFLVLQFNEYRFGQFTIADSVFGSTFYMTTGLHGSHVLVGVLFLSFCLLRLYRDGYTTHHAEGLEFALYYWHFVDIVWLFVFLSFYWWGS